jgi:RecB family endonuclease NucS
MSNLEEDIEDYLESFPELIDPIFNFQEYTIERQYSINGNRIDLLISKKSELKIFIIEIKINQLTTEDYEQIFRYYKLIKEKNPYHSIFGFLIGLRNKSFLKIDKRKFKWLTIKYLEEDIPKKVKICISCRRPINYFCFECKHCFFRF